MMIPHMPVCGPQAVNLVQKLSGLPYQRISVYACLVFSSCYSSVL